MTEERIREILKRYFPGSFEPTSEFLTRPESKLVLGRLQDSPQHPLNRTQANQLLHLCHEAGLSEGFFRYYFLDEPPLHPYPVNRVIEGPMPSLDHSAVWTIEQLDWGLRRFFTDALLYWGNIRSAYRDLRTKEYAEIESLFSKKRHDTEQMQQRGEPFPLESIPDEDRYLISETACKAYGTDEVAAVPQIKAKLLELAQAAQWPTTVRQVLSQAGGGLDKQTEFLLRLGATDLMDVQLQGQEELAEKIDGVAGRFLAARKAGTVNTHRYLSLVSEMDVYVATSMREKQQFLDVATSCREIFEQNSLKKLNLRYFDPTMSAAAGHEDKGLIECLMVKCAKASLYFAGEADSFGKDAEVAMTMSLGKPVVILCPDTEKGKERERIFRDIHPLSKLIDFQSGVVNGAMITRDKDTARELLARIFENRMEYDYEQTKGYFRLRERLTKSVVRLQTSDRLLRETFWNYYHGIA